MIKALLFDLDGVIIDSGDLHFQAWQAFCANINKNITYDDFKKGFGQRNKDILNDLLKRTLTDEEIKHFSDEKENIFRKLARGKLKQIPGARDFIIQMKQSKMLTGLVSSTPRANIDFILEEINLVNYFDTIISSEDVSEGKPSPECYLKAAERLMVTPKECVVFEDAIPGIQAAISANMKCIALTTTQPSSKLTQATIIVDSWAEIAQLNILKWASY